MAKILITGSAGLIGQALVEKLRGRFEVAGLDIRHSKTSNWYGDINNYAKVESKTRGCDGIIHLAAVSRIAWGEREPDLCWHTNVLGSNNILRAASKLSNKPWLIYASSKEVYGQQSTLPVKENAPLKPLNIYAQSKRQSEEYFMQAREQGLNTAIVRFSNVFGRVDDYEDRVVPAFCRAALQGYPLRLEGAENILDFTYVEDVATGTIQLVEYLHRQKPLPSPLHFTTGRGVTLQELAHMVCKLTNSSSSLIKTNARTYGVSHFYGDSTFTQDILRWKPIFSLQEGLKKFLKELQISLPSFQSCPHEGA